MTHATEWGEEFRDEEEQGAVLPPRPLRDDSEMDITPMIDCTFLLLIFFLVCSTQAKQSAVELAPARHGTGVDPDTAVVFTLAPGGQPDQASVFVGDGTAGSPLVGDAEQQANLISQTVDNGFAAGKSNVLVKAERSVPFREVSRVSAAATAEREGVNLYLAVEEKNAE